MTGEARNREALLRLAALIAERNRVEQQIAQVIGRPGEPSHVGEFIASLIFDIDLHESALAKASDGYFRIGPLAGRSVNVKWYGQRQGVLDVSTDPTLDCYLVLTGSPGEAGSSRRGVRPWVIDHVYLFEQQPLVGMLTDRGVQIGVATSVQNAVWEAAEIYPTAQNPVLDVSRQEALLLAAFSTERESFGAREGG